jgi:hypothetical protein
MANKIRGFVGFNNRALLVSALALLVFSLGAGQAQAQPPNLTASSGSMAMTQQTSFYCNTKALSPSERERHKQATTRLISLRNRIEETAKGYEFQFSPSNVSLEELAEWVASEGKCCPFFDFHIDLEREGNLLCLRLTGPEGVKAFIKAEFQVPQK